MDKTKATRFDKAKQLVLDGRIRLHPGTGTATAKFLRMCDSDIDSYLPAW